MRGGPITAFKENKGILNNFIASDLNNLDEMKIP